MEQTTKAAEERLNAFSLKYPSIEYELPDGTRAVYEPIPDPENPDEAMLVGTYPDFVVLSIAAERDELQLEVDQIQSEIEKTKEETLKIMKETYDLQRVMTMRGTCRASEQGLGAGGKPFGF